MRDKAQLPDDAMQILTSNQIDGAALKDLDEDLLVEIGFGRLRAK